MPSRFATQAMIIPCSPILSICALQPSLRESSRTPHQAIDHAIDLMCRAKRTNDDISLFILPELSPIGYSEHTFSHYLPETTEKQQIYRDLDTKMADTAKRLSVHICYGSIGWHQKDTRDPGRDNQQPDIPSSSSSLKSSNCDFTIRQIVVEPTTGKQIAVYDKMYLCNVGDCSESRFFVPSPSRRPVSFTIGSFRFGLMICFDQRFPSLARTYASEHDVDVLLHPAAFVRDVTFATWKSFRETRAVENSCYFVGLNYSGADHGETNLVPPWVDDSGNPDSTAMTLGCEESWLICDIQRTVLDRVRTTYPFYKILKEEATTIAG